MGTVPAQTTASPRGTNAGRAASRTALATFVILVVGGAAWFGWSRHQQLSREFECKNYLRNFYEMVRQKDDTLSAAASVYSFGQPRETVECTCSGQPFIYHPFEGKIDQFGQKQGSRVLFRMIAWCPHPCHDGHRVVLLENGAVHVLTEGAFQSAVQNAYLCENRSVMNE